MRRSIALGLALATAQLSCADTSRFSTAPDESYCGTITGASFVRSGIRDGTRMRLELRADELQSAPGRLWTDRFPDRDEKLEAAELRVIPELLHDPLSQFTFGEGRVKNGIYVVDLGETQLLAVLSLLESGEVEVRLIRGASPGSAAKPNAGPPQLFGVFRLKREKGDCGLR